MNAVWRTERSINWTQYRKLTRQDCFSVTMLSLLQSFWTGYDPNLFDDVHNKVINLIEEKNPSVCFEFVYTKVDEDDDLLVHSIECQLKDSKRDCPSDAAPIVLIHGYTAGALMFASSMAELAKATGRKIIAVDLLGCGRSSRPTFLATGVDEAVMFFVDGIEKWRVGRKLESMDVIAHSMSAVFIVKYLIRYDESHQIVRNLVLASPTGFGLLEDVQIESTQYFRRLSHFVWSQGINPHQVIRACGPFGKILTRKWLSVRFRGDLTLGIPELDAELLNHRELFVDYMHQNCIAPASGEHVLKYILLPGGFSRIPLFDAISDMKKLNTLIIFGTDDWMPRSVEEINRVIRGSSGRLETIKGIHHVYLSDDFTDLVKEHLDANRAD